MSTRTRTEKIWLGGTAVVAALVLVIGWFLLISPQRAQTASVAEQVAGAQTQNLALQAKIADLQSRKSQLSAYRRALQQAQEALPEITDSKATPRLISTLQAMAAATSTRITQLTIGSPAGETATAAAPTAAASSAPASSDSSAAPAPAVVAPPSMYTTAITLGVAGRNRALIAFLDQLQEVQPRAALVSAVTLGSSVGAGTPGTTQNAATSTLAVTMTIFSLPPAGATTATTPGATPAAAAPSSSAGTP